MKRTFIASLAVLLCLPLCLSAQDVNTRPTVVAVIDIAKVFEQHQGFNASMEQIKGEVTAFEKQMETRQLQLQEQAQGLKSYSPGAPEYKRMEAELAKKEADMQIEAAQKRKEVLNQEARLYLDTYNQIVAAVTQIAEYPGNDITLVIRYDSSDIDPNDRASVIKGVNRNVVYNSGYDLTDMVLTMVNGQPAASAAQR